MTETAAKTMASARKASGLTQEQMAQLLGVTKVTVSHWENAKGFITLEKMQRWYAALPEEGRAVMRSMNIYSGVQ